MNNRTAWLLIGLAAGAIVGVLLAARSSQTGRPSRSRARRLLRFRPAAGPPDEVPGEMPPDEGEFTRH